jgi:enamine deaminase RidA (YjgF/YER057c/UK114 family)
LSKVSDSSKRRSIHVDGFSHGANPIPAASRVGNVVITGGIAGQDPATEKVPDDPAAQVAFAFTQMGRILAAAGASPENIVKVECAVKDFALRDAINKEWLKMFPDEHSRPARHVTKYDHFGGNVQIQLTATAVIA